MNALATACDAKLSALTTTATFSGPPPAQAAETQESQQTTNQEP